MSIGNNITTLPDTRQSFESFGNDLTLFAGCFVTDEDLVWPDLESWLDFDYWHTLMGNDSLIPIHFAKEFTPNNEETQIAESQQDFSYLLRHGRYKNKLKYDLNFDVHQAIQSLNGTKKKIVYYDYNWNIYGTSDDGVTYRGFTPNRIIVPKLDFATGSLPAFSTIDIELKDSNEINISGKVNTVEWNPEDVDRLYANINIDYISSTDLNFTVKYNGTPVTNIGSSETTVTDQYNGVLTFSFLNAGAGVYQLSSFNKELITGTLKILSSLYLGCVLYRVVIVVTVTNSYVFDDALANNFVLEDSNNFIFDN